MPAPQGTAHVYDRTRPPLIPATALVVDTANGTIIPISEPGPNTDRRTARVLELRAAATIAGQCPSCGARIERPNRQARRDATRAGYVLRAKMAHQRGCPAGDERVPMA